MYFATKYDWLTSAHGYFCEQVFKNLIKNKVDQWACEELLKQIDEQDNSDNIELQTVHHFYSSMLGFDRKINK